MDTRQIFQNLYGHAPEWVARAPGRINLIGEHVDYLDGVAFPMAIDKHLELAASQNDSGKVRFWSSGLEKDPEELVIGSFSTFAYGGSWRNYITGVLCLLGEQGVKVGGLDLVACSTLPVGAGLSSSAALTTAMTLCVEAMAGIQLGTLERAKLCQLVEHRFANVPCGIMDQLAVSQGDKGSALQIDCRNLRVDKVKLPEGLEVVVADTGVKHSLADGEYKQRRKECDTAKATLGVASLRDVDLATLEANKGLLADTIYRRARHAVTEMQRVQDFSDALQSQDLERAGKLMLGSHQSLKDDFEVSCAELDTLVDAAYRFGSDNGLVGSRMTGGGFGGSTVSLVQSWASESFIEHLQKEYKTEEGKDISPFTTHPSEGAKVARA